MSCSSWLQFVAHRQFALTLLWYLARGDEGGKQSSHHIYRTCQPKFVDNDGREQGHRLESKLSWAILYKPVYKTSSAVYNHMIVTVI